MLYNLEVGMTFHITVTTKWYLNTLLDIDPEEFDSKAQENGESLQMI